MGASPASAGGAGDSSHYQAAEFHAAARRSFPDVRSNGPRHPSDFGRPCLCLVDGSGQTQPSLQMAKHPCVSTHDRDRVCLWLSTLSIQTTCAVDMELAPCSCVLC